MNCYLCKSPMREFLKKNGYEIYRCPSCGLKTTRLNTDYEQFVNRFYSQGYFTGAQKYGAYANYRDDKWFIVQNMKKFLKQIKRYKSSGKLLDVGCAMGFFVELALGNGYDAYGFDPSEYAAAYAKKSVDGRVRHATIQSVHYPEKSFDVITVFDVVEHLGDPQKDLRKLSNYLKDDGILLIATGNAGSLSAKVFRRRWPFYTPPQHLFYFTKKNFETLLRQSGFTPIYWFGIGKWLSLRYVLHLARSNSESRLAKILYPLVGALRLGSFPMYLSLRDNMMVVARKAL